MACLARHSTPRSGGQPEINILLMAAAASDDRGGVKDLLRAGADPTVALHAAVQTMNEVCLYLLLAAGADVQSRNEVGNTVLHVAATTNCAPIISQLLSHGADLETQDANGNTALLLAALHGSCAAFELLICAGANARATNKRLLTAIHLAAFGEADDEKPVGVTTTDYEAIFDELFSHAQGAQLAEDVLSPSSKIQLWNKHDRKRWAAGIRATSVSVDRPFGRRLNAKLTRGAINTTWFVADCFDGFARPAARQRIDASMLVMWMASYLIVSGWFRYPIDILATFLVSSLGCWRTRSGQGHVYVVDEERKMLKEV